MNGILEGLDTTSRIKALIASRNITQADFAKTLSVTPETISNRMRTGKWDVAELKTIAAEYGIEITDLI
jgi:transcriptional regulator with XRE-family HTH domain